jgi:hypothetical protein
MCVRASGAIANAEPVHDSTAIHDPSSKPVHNPQRPPRRNCNGEGNSIQQNRALLPLASAAPQQADYLPRCRRLLQRVRTGLCALDRRRISGSPVLGSLAKSRMAARAVDAVRPSTAPVDGQKRLYHKMPVKHATLFDDNLVDYKSITIRLD